MKRILLLVYTLFFAIYAYSQSQQDSSARNHIVVGSNVNINNSKIVGGDENHYYGLDSAQIAKLDTINLSVKNLLNKLEKLNSLYEQDDKYGDSILLLSRTISRYQSQINELKRINDSIMQTKQGDEIIYKKLFLAYEAELRENLKEFFDEFPNFDPNSNIQFVEIMEKLRGETYSNIPIPYSGNTPTFSACNSCIRQYPGEWRGIIINGKNYLFESEEFQMLSIHIKGFGPVSLRTIKTKYNQYWKIVKNKDFYVDKPFERYLKDKTLLISDLTGSLYTKVKECEALTAELIIENNRKGAIAVYAYFMTSATSYSNYNPIIINVEGNSFGTLYNLKEGVYKIIIGDLADASFVGRTIRDEQVKVMKCEKNTFKVR